MLDTEEILETTPEESTEEISEETSEESVEEISEEVSEETSEEISEEFSEITSEVGTETVVYTTDPMVVPCLQIIICFLGCFAIFGVCKFAYKCLDVIF